MWSFMSLLSLKEADQSLLGLMTTTKTAEHRSCSLASQDVINLRYRQTGWRWSREEPRMLRVQGLTSEGVFPLGVGEA